MAVLGLIWGASFLFIKRSVGIFTPLQMAMWRMVLATVIYLPVAAVYWSKINWKKWRPLLIVAFCGSALPNFFFAIAQQHVNSSLAGALNALTPLFTLVIGASFFRMKVSWSRFWGIVVGLSGAMMLILLNSSTAVSGSAFFAFLCVLATVCYAINANAVGHYLRDQHPAAISSAAFMITGGFFVAGLVYSGGWTAVWQHPRGMEGLGYVFYLSALGTVGGSILYFWLLQRNSPLFATSVTYLLPVTAMLLGVLDGEAISAIDIAGTLVILAGLYLARK